MNAELKGNLRRWFVSIPRTLAVSFLLTLLLTMPFLKGWRGIYAGLVFSTCCAMFGSFLADVLADWCLRKPSPFNWIVSFGALLAAGVSGFATGMTWLVATGFSRQPRGYQDIRITLFVCIANTFVFSSALYLVNSTRLKLERTRRNLREKEISAAKAAQLATEAQLESLAARLHPHFLFNTLNSISALIHEDPRGADAMVQHLSTLLRYSLDAHGKRLVPLGQELSVTRDYLDIERVRFENRLRVECDVPAALEETMIPPFALQTLVENSVKFAVGARRAGGTIRIAARRTPDAVELAVTDDGPGFSLFSLKPGHGLDLLRTRLTALFGERGTLSVAVENGCTVTISIPAAQSVEMEREARHDATVAGLSR